MEYTIILIQECTIGISWATAYPLLIVRHPQGITQNTYKTQKHKIPLANMKSMTLTIIIITHPHKFHITMREDRLLQGLFIRIGAAMTFIQGIIYPHTPGPIAVHAWLASLKNIPRFGIQFARMTIVQMVFIIEHILNCI